MSMTHQIGEYEFYKDNPDSKIWNVRHVGYKGELLFSFDGKTMITLINSQRNKRNCLIRNSHIGQSFLRRIKTEYDFITTANAMSRLQY